MSRISKKKDEGGHGGAGMERWLLTYADLITLLMAFFVIMYAMSTVDAEKYAAMAQSLKIALGIEASQPRKAAPNLTTSSTEANSKTTLAEKARQRKLTQIKNAHEERVFASMIDQIENYAKGKGISNTIIVKEDPRGIVINLSDKLLFEVGKADLSPAAKALLDDLATILFSSGKHIKIEGHTDNTPIHNERYPSNWQLSTDRATSVIMHWISKHPEVATRLSAAGYGEYRPVASNATPEGRARNRRVDIIVLRDAISIGEPVSIGSESKPYTGD